MAALRAKATARLIAASSMDIVIADHSRWDTCDHGPTGGRTARFSPIAPQFGPSPEPCAERWEEFYAARKPDAAA
jgi:hypothetical protein